MNVADLLAEVEGWGGTVDLDQDKLVVDVPEAFPDAIVERLRIHKPEIVHHAGHRGNIGELVQSTPSYAAEPTDHPIRGRHGQGHEQHEPNKSRRDISSLNNVVEDQIEGKEEI